MLVREIALACSSFLLLYSLFPSYKTAAFALWPLLFIWSWLKWFCHAKLNIPFSLGLLRFLPHAKTFADSIRYLKVHRPLLIALPLFGASFFLLTPSLTLWLPVWTLSATLQFLARKKKTFAPAYHWEFSTEHSLPIDSNYPLLRHTLAFTGPKQLEIQRGEKPHVILIFLESFRSKNIGALGAPLGASPHFDLLAKNGALFTQFYANGLQTYRAMISSFFGVPGHVNTMSLAPFLSVPMIGLPEILKKEGYRTALFQGNPSTFDGSFPFLHKAGFETILGSEHFPSEKKSSWGVTDEVLFREAAAWLEKQTEPTFLSLFTISNHHPWESPLKFPTPQNLPEPYRKYLQTFAYSDQCLGQLIERLKQSGLYEKSVIFILGDHGQEMGERKGTFALHNDLYQENIHIPLLILGAKKTVIEEPASQVDLFPTILDLLNIQAAHHSVGRSLLRKGSSPVFISMPRKSPLIGLVFKTHKLILGQKEEYYNLSTDPEEKISLPAPDELKQQAQSYFQSIEDLYARSAWAPAAFDPPSSILNLSNSLSVNLEISHFSKEKALHLHECNFSNAPFLTDTSLNWVANHCPNLSILNVPGCPLISHESLALILHKCPSLRSLNIEGNSDIEHIPIEKETSLEALHLKTCSSITGPALAHMALYSPRLIYLAASLEKSEDADLEAIGSHLKQLNFLWLENGPLITDNALNRFLSANPQLTILILENFPKVERIQLQGHKNLHTLKFSNCLNLTDETIASLAGLHIQNLSIVSCPKISK